MWVSSRLACTRRLTNSGGAGGPSAVAVAAGRAVLYKCGPHPALSVMLHDLRACGLTPTHWSRIRTHWSRTRAAAAAASVTYRTRHAARPRRLWGQHSAHAGAQGAGASAVAVSAHESSAPCPHGAGRPRTLRCAPAAPSHQRSRASLTPSTVSSLLRVPLLSAAAASAGSRSNPHQHSIAFIALSVHLNPSALCLLLLQQLPPAPLAPSVTPTN